MSDYPSFQNYNYSAGPAILPRSVYQCLQEELNKDKAIRLLELGHRCAEFAEIVAQSESNLRELLSIPDTYAVLFLPGGARIQYSMVPLNLNPQQKAVGYFDTGYWSQCAIKEASKYAQVSVINNLNKQGVYSLPEQSEWRLTEDMAYCHYVSNETLSGFEFTPDISGLNLVSDMTSNLLTAPIDISNHCAIYSAVQKNMGTAGITVVIIARDVLGNANPLTPSVYNYTEQEKAKSLLSTPPVVPWYVCHLMLEWIKDEGGVVEMYRRSLRRSETIYQCIDKSSIYEGLVASEYRSRVNIAFRIRPSNLEAKFIQEAEEHGLFGLKGHKEIGGIRASLYNGMPVEGADVLATFMQEFERCA